MNRRDLLHGLGGAGMAGAAAFIDGWFGAVMAAARMDSAAAITPLMFGAKGDGIAIDGQAIQRAIGAATSGIVFVPAGIYLVDGTLRIPAHTHLIGDGPSSIIRVVGYDTHGRNSQIFEMFDGSLERKNNPVVIALEGDHASVQNLRIDCNGRNNHKPNSAYGGLADWLIETDRVGICGIRIGGLHYRKPGEPSRTIRGSFVRGCDIRNGSWGAIAIQGQIMNEMIGRRAPATDLFGVRECGVYDCHLEGNNSNTIQINGAIDAEVRGCTLVSPYHTGIKAYTRVKGAIIDGNTIVCDDARQYHWDPRQPSVAAYRERELATRSELICIGHSDYDTDIADVTVSNNRIDGDGVGVMHGVIVHGGSIGATVSGNDITGCIRSVSFTCPRSVTISGNRLRSSSYATRTLSKNVSHGGVDIGLYARHDDARRRAFDQARIHVEGNVSSGSGVSNIRIDDFHSYDVAGIKAVIMIERNEMDVANIAPFGDMGAAPVLIGKGPAAGGECLLRGNSYKKNGVPIRNADIFKVAAGGFASLKDNLK
jgi:hypothetical protein